MNIKKQAWTSFDLNKEEDIPVKITTLRQSFIKYKLNPDALICPGFTEVDILLSHCVVSSWFTPSLLIADLYKGHLGTLLGMDLLLRYTENDKYEIHDYTYSKTFHNHSNPINSTRINFSIVEWYKTIIKRTSIPLDI